MFCKKCGSEIGTDSIYCPKCGTKVEDNLSKEEYDPLLALDNVETVEDDMVWQEAPLGDESIIINAAEGRQVNPVVNEQEQQAEKQEADSKDNANQGLRAAKSTIAHPIKPKRRVKPKTVTPKEPVAQTEETIPQTMQETVVELTPEVVEPVKETVPETPVEEVVEEVPQVEETVVIEETDQIIADDEMEDIFDDFVVDDSFGIIDESPEIVEETPEVIEEAPKAAEETQEVVETEPEIVEEVQETVTTPEVAPVVETPVETPVETVKETSEPITEEIVTETSEVEEIVYEPTEEEKVTPEQALFTDEIIIEEEPVVEEPVTENVVKSEPVKEEVETEKVESNEDAVQKARDMDLEEVITSESQSEIMKSLSSTKIDKEDIEPVIGDEDSAIKSQFNSTLDDEDELFDVDENVNSLTNKITTVLIIILILIIAAVVATFLVQNIGL